MDRDGEEKGRKQRAREIMRKEEVRRAERRKGRGNGIMRKR